MYRTKALELYNKYREGKPNVLCHNEEAQKNALIAVDVIIDLLKSEGIEYGARNWECVRAELKELNKATE